MMWDRPGCYVDVVFPVINPPKTESYALDALTLAVFATDPEVVAHVERVAERPEAHEAAMGTAFDRGFAGESPEWRWYVRATDRAKAMVGVMR